LRQSSRCWGRRLDGPAVLQGGMHRTTASIARSWSVAHDGVTSGRSCGKGGSRLGPSACGCHSRTWVSTAGSAASQTPSDVRSRRARPGAPSATPEFPSDMLSDAHLPVTIAATTPKQARETTPPADAPPTIHPCWAYRDGRAEGEEAADPRCTGRKPRLWRRGRRRETRRRRRRENASPARPILRPPSRDPPSAPSTVLPAPLRPAAWRARGWTPAPTAH